MRAILLCAALSGLLAGCEPTCANTCDKLLSCSDDGTVEQPRVNDNDCEAACKNEQDLYEKDWEDTQLSDAFSDMKKCVRDSSCEDIDAGVCYDSDLYIF